MAEKPFLMGAETEYGVSGREGDRPLEAEDVYDALSEVIRAERAWVPDDHGYRGLYLQHGGRLYLDYGAHPEHATPECFTPREVTRYDKAGEYLMALAKAGAERAREGLRITILKNNADPLFPADITYGTHESYTGWVDSGVAAAALLPHLVSRVLYCGAGGLSAHADGTGFDLSQRARHLNETIGGDTTYNRAIFGTRVRKESDSSEAGWTRLHFIGKDSQRAPFGIYLTYATTGLLVELLNRGRSVAHGVALARPVEALHAFSRDPSLRAQAELTDGRRLTALEIQSAYLELCERELQAGGLPEWAGEAVGHWRDTLTLLERDPRLLADRLDSWCKFALLESRLRSSGLDWVGLRDGLTRLQQARYECPDRVMAALLTDSEEGLNDDQRACLAQGRSLIGPHLDRVRVAVGLQALDVQYHEVGGLYDKLAAAGVIRGVVVTPAEVEEASRVPPAGGRAAARGAYIAAHREAGWRGDWQYVWQTGTGKCLDLRDPFGPAERREVTLGLDADQDADGADVLNLLSEAPA